MVIGEGSRLYNCSIEISGNDNRIFVDRDCELKNLTVFVGDGGMIRIGHNTWFTGKIQIACLEGKNVSIGERCLFSNHIVLRTGDSHAILNTSGERLNLPKNIVVGDHVWIAQNVFVLKGAHIGDDTIVGANSLVTAKEFPNNVILAGSPAKVIKSDVIWNPDVYWHLNQAECLAPGEPSKKL